VATLAAVEAMPTTWDALLAGEVSFAQAAEIARVPGCEAELLEVARNESLRTLERRATRRHLENIDREELAVEQHRRRSVTHRLDELNMCRGAFAFRPEFGGRFTKRLDRETDRVVREAQRSGRTITRAQAAADAFERLFDGSAKARIGPSEVVFVISPDAFARGHTHPGELCHILGGGPVPVRLVRERVIDAFVKAVIHDGTKVDTIIHYGRRRPAILQSVLDLGSPPEFDGVSCCEEGCDRRFGLQWDHVDPVANGGVTSRDNLEARCLPDHVAKTERDWAKGLLGGRPTNGRKQRQERKPP
jgi:hypothetical protein